LILQRFEAICVAVVLLFRAVAVAGLMQLFVDVKALEWSSRQWQRL